MAQKYRDPEESVYKRTKYPPLLSRDDEIRLAKKIERGGRGSEIARKTFIISNIGLVITVALELAQSDQILDDLIQEGLVGLAYAVGEFDWRRGHRFTSLAKGRIRHHILAFISRKQLVGAVMNEFWKSRRLDIKLDRYFVEFGRKPDTETFAKNMVFPSACMMRKKEVR